MKIVQIGTNVANDDLTTMIGDSQPEILLLVEPLEVHNSKILSCYERIKNIHLENVAISINNEKSMSFYYHPKDGPLFEVASTNKYHLVKHGYNADEIIKLDVKCININDLFKKHNLKEIDVLFIDAEGIDDLIIKSINFDQVSIKQIYFENLHLTQTDIFYYLNEKGYGIIPHCFSNGWTSAAIKE
jgi:FkbM family methyltransferase